MAPEPADLVGAHEIRHMLGVSRQRLQQLAARPDFPEPAGTLRLGRVWRRAEITAWATAHNRTITEEES